MRSKSTHAKPARKGTRTKADTFPLFLRPDGRWCKKIRGKHVYFGRDRTQALEAYKRHVGLVAVGLAPDSDNMGLRELFNRYLTNQAAAMKAGMIGARTVSDSAGTLRRVLRIVGDRLVSTLVSDDFATLKGRLAKGRSIITVAGDIRRTKAAFNWAYREGLIRAVPRYGDTFKPAPARAVRLAKSKRAALMFDADEVQSLIDAANPQLAAMIYLGANCALLPVDIARLEQEEISADWQWLRQARHKTGVDRLAWLWPETAAAVRRALEARTKPAKPEYRGLVFLTESGRPVVRTRTPAKAKKDKRAALNATVINRVTADFRELQQACGLYRHRRGFNALRHGFLTIAEAGRDFPAVAKVMGHALPGVSTHYREHIGDDRIKAVCEVVRGWLLAAGEKLKPR